MTIVIVLFYSFLGTYLQFLRNQNICYRIILENLILRILYSTHDNIHLSYIFDALPKLFLYI